MRTINEIINTLRRAGMNLKEDVQYGHITKSTAMYYVEKFLNAAKDLEAYNKATDPDSDDGYKYCVTLGYVARHVVNVTADSEGEAMLLAKEQFPEDVVEEVYLDPSGNTNYCVMLKYSARYSSYQKSAGSVEDAMQSALDSFSESDISGIVYRCVVTVDDGHGNILYDNTKQETLNMFAKMLDRMACAAYITEAEEKYARDYGIVIACASGEDMLKFRGTISGKADIHDMGKVYMGGNGYFVSADHATDYEISECQNHITAFGNGSIADGCNMYFHWAFNTDFLHEDFTVCGERENPDDRVKCNGDEWYCRGFVFYLDDLEKGGGSKEDEPEKHGENRENALGNCNADAPEDTEPVGQDKTSLLKTFAIKLDNQNRRDSNILLTEDDIDYAKDHGIVIAYAAGFDHLLFRGAMEDMCDCSSSDFGMIFVDKDGFTENSNGNRISVNDIRSVEDEFGTDYFWSFDVNFPHEDFTASIDTEAAVGVELMPEWFCRGFVFYLKDLKEDVPDKAGEKPDTKGGTETDSEDDGDATDIESKYEDYTDDASLLKKFAKSLDGREYGYPQFSQESLEFAKKHGIVIVHGMSDDLMEFEGAVTEEYGCFEGGMFYVGKNGEAVPEDECVDTENYPHYIEARWCADCDGQKDIISWTYRTDIPHETFMILEEDGLYCRGIVFFLKDLKRYGKIEGKSE